MNWRDAMTVTVPEGELDGLRVERFEVPASSVEGMRLAMRGRGCLPGTYTRLLADGRLWMSDTDAEKRDHYEPLRQMMRTQATHVLINGLGLGMVLAAALDLDHVEYVDVVEIDERVIKLVGPHYDAMARERGKFLGLYCADAYEQAKRWPVGTHWDVAWHDIWPDLCEDNLPEMARLHRSYGRRVGWQGSWGKTAIEAERRRTANAWWRR